MATYDFEAPSWLESQSAEIIHARMMGYLPTNIDDTEGGFPWDFTKPSALEKAELLEYQMMETVKIMFPQFAYGIYLDYHAQAANLTRKEAGYATGTVTVTGDPGIEIPEGFEFAVPASGGVAAVLFATTEDATIDYTGTVEIPIQAVEAGTSGNVAADTIIIMATEELENIEKVTNDEATSGGTVEEDDDDLRDRIMTYYKERDASYVGCDSDYTRWALAVTGVGQVIVVPEWDGPGTVLLVLIDENGDPASDAIVEAVYDYIVSPDDRDLRLAPIGATVTVTAPDTVEINISCDLTLEDDADSDTVLADIQSALTAYFLEAKSAGVVKRSIIGATILSVDGVDDYAHLRVNDGRTNITIDSTEMPVLGTLVTDASSSEDEEE
ncbi:MAG: baseplate J/gp47 family protein [Lachnospiraceae bacterium]|nr:baseplate J/gp47 family protein [Lachnospiraceae bacterium]